MTTAKLTLKDVRQAAAAHGARISGGTYGRMASYTADAPPGRLWSDTGASHLLAFAWAVDGKGEPVRPDDEQHALADVLERMAAGLTRCNDAWCDYCHPQG